MHSHGYNVVHSNNSINENKYNNEKLMKSSPVYKIKKILKPIAALLKSKKADKQQKEQEHFYVPENQFVPDYDYDNSANERLESQLLAEIAECHANAAIFVYEDNQVHIQPVQPEEQYVPVHFARTEAGTFFWTTTAREADSDLIPACKCASDLQLPQQEFCDRWAQA
ncbi:enhancer of split malpha protein-like [Toxorhynchites rutilus septentrionalis]|uniref:enhancer of split malpha protein-like n=1 Tax=Toxorhynchites rutilus septentrionalis TaxID=329112 RepID=UPI002479851D|nr:enhancer of split malpha protein-like [Toxorhynchites rutilus septentrionalis]